MDDKKSIQEYFLQESQEDDSAPNRPSTSSLSSYRLSTRFPDPEDEGGLHIAIWGTPESGKTTYIATLYRQLVTNPRWNLASVLADTDDARWTGELYNRLKQHGVFPDDTRRGQHKFLRFKLLDGEREVARFTFLDAPAEMFLNPEGYDARYKTGDPLEYLRKCHGLILLVDPDDPDGAETEALTRTLSGITRALLRSKPVALCLTKCDLPDMRGLLSGDQERIRDFVSQRLSPELVAFVDRAVEARHWFACTSLGYITGLPPNTYTRFNGRPGFRTEFPLTPINVEQPLEWLVSLLDR